ncbi:MAG TPA: PorV/PorQ family protein [Candidatus Cloacimonadota bacterium]|nr:PorV/PorQ family protein [Candidatus Cloacimonadota bacterium]HPK40522.1 PorV/PorQ family protein [Candidatus Cloacimonadota bacterium]
MKKMITIAISLLLISVLGAETADSHAGEYGFQFLKFNLSPAMSAQAGTGGFYSASASIVTQDPVASLNIKAKSVHFSQMQLNHFDANAYSVAWRDSGLNSSIGWFFTTLDYGKIDERLDNGTLVGEYHPIDLNLGMNYAKRITSNQLLGVTVHGLYTKIHTESALGMSVDFGYLWQTPLQNTNIYANAKNIGFTDKMKNERIDIPYALEFGVNYHKSFNELIKMNLEAKTIKHEDDDEAKFNLGGQVALYDILSLRAGYRLNYDIESFTTGFGVHWNRFEIDYSYIPIDLDNLGDTHHIGLTYYY